MYKGNCDCTELLIYIEIGRPCFQTNKKRKSDLCNDVRYISDFLSLRKAYPVWIGIDTWQGKRNSLRVAT